MAANLSRSIRHARRGSRVHRTAGTRYHGDVKELDEHSWTSIADVGGGVVRGDAEAEGPQAVSAGPDARAAAALQFGLRRVRKNSVSRARAEEAVDAGGMFPRGGRMRRADREYPGRRTADAPADSGDRQRADCAQEIHLPLHQRAAAERA